MVLTLLLGATLFQQPQLPAHGPKASETAKLYFLAGDLAKAQDWARRGLTTEKRTCERLHKALVEYSFLANRSDAFSLLEAKQFIELDRHISPGTPGKLTQAVLERFVDKPLSLAAARAEGDVSGALRLVDQVLTVEPHNSVAKALKKKLRNGLDAGT